MKYILTKKQYSQLNEMIKLDIKIGDTIMGGKFKTRKVIVKDIGKNEKGDITINGKPLLRFRIIKEDNRIETFQKLINNSLNNLDRNYMRNWKVCLTEYLNENFK